MRRNASSLGKTFTLTYNMLLNALDGFVKNLDLDVQARHTCPKCGTTPKYFVGDGVTAKLLKRKVENVNVKGKIIGPLNPTQ